MSLHQLTLSRKRGQPVVASEGVYFRMMRGRHEVTCLATRAALSELAGHPLEISQLEFVYFKHYLLLAEAAKSQFKVTRRRYSVVVVSPEGARKAMSSWPSALN